eukprot:3381411-Rhodomonas_salina.1
MNVHERGGGQLADVVLHTTRNKGPLRPYLKRRGNNSDNSSPPSSSILGVAAYWVINFGPETNKPPVESLRNWRSLIRIKLLRRQPLAKIETLSEALTEALYKASVNA